MQIADGEDTLWKPDEREIGPSVKRRGLDFVKWLNERPESRIAVVSHSSFLFFLFSNFGRDCSDPVKVSHPLAPGLFWSSPLLVFLQHKSQEKIVHA